MLCQPFIRLFPWLVYICHTSQPIYHCLLYQSFQDDLKPLSWQSGVRKVSLFLTTNLIFQLLTVCALFGVVSMNRASDFGAIFIKGFGVFSTLLLCLVPHINHFWFLFTTWLLQLQVLKRQVAKNIKTFPSLWICFLVLSLSFFGNLCLAHGDHIRRVHPHCLGKEYRWKMSWHIYITIPSLLLQSMNQL